MIPSAFVRFENVYKGLEVAKALYKNKEILNIIRSDQRFKITPARAIFKPRSAFGLHSAARAAQPCWRIVNT